MITEEQAQAAIAQAAAVVTGLESKKRLLIEKQAGLEDQRRP